MDAEFNHPYPPSSYDDSDNSEELSSPQLPPVQLPLSPISNSPPDHSNSNTSRPQIGANAPDYVLPFLPPFPMVASNLDNTEEAGEMSEERQRKEQERQVEELKKQEEAAAKEKAEKEGEGVEVVQTFPANYIVPASYDVSKLQSRGAWHLPSLSSTVLGEQLALSPSKPTAENPFKAGTGAGTTDELLAALHAFTPSDPTNMSLTHPSSSANISTNPLRHKVSLVFLGTTPARYNTPDTLFGLTAGLAPTPRPAHPLPAYVQPLEVQPGMKAKGLDKGKKDIDPASLPVPPAQSRSVGVTPSVVNAVTSTTSRIAVIGKSLLPVSLQSIRLRHATTNLILILRRNRPWSGQSDWCPLQRRSETRNFYSITTPILLYPHHGTCLCLERLLNTQLRVHIQVLIK